MKIFLSPILFCLIAATVSIAKAQQQDGAASDNVIAKKLDEYINSAVKLYQFNGSVLVARKGKIILQKGYGWKNIAGHTFNNANSIFQIGSLTKPFTAEVILKLQEQGKLSVHDKLSKYFPAYPNGNNITIENLLTHTSGIHNYTDDIDEKDTAIISHPVPKQKVVDAFINKKPEFKPGAKFMYNNSGYYLLGMIIEIVTGKPYEQIVREVIFNPLQMTHSGFDFVHLADTSKTKGYIVLKKDKQVPNYSVDSTVYYSAGAIYSTTGDLYKWARSIAAKQILSDDSWKQALTPRLEKYGLGWWIDTLYNRKYIYHSGGLIGFMSYFTYYPDDDVTIILLNNFGNYENSLVPINTALSAILFNRTYSLWEIKTAIKVDQVLLKQYVGTYTLDGKVKIFITLKDSQLYAESNSSNGIPKLPIYAKSENEFFLKDFNAVFAFIKDADGRVSKFISHESGKDIEFKKIK